uniref:OTU domain-containing protein n=1 Tax=Chromera velia CCMP2878 TaxID=1169474 RepID=A0A0G4HRA8_9ALVE|eukprot:Cvel_30488.t1-p1 / transcript=Cvel_30488.t1 / gene=Cvel_30488 / organism=Chromera_velia_CCMP2878 / gene_product=hypothetical protein / transcript_product=hypothetical protein / location=Cvel_scaffold4356:6269-7211(-) / protein_length=223 / sequence_SO=supercontig / SO=protein_coding / is_pseudo=false
MEEGGQSKKTSQPVQPVRPVSQKRDRETQSAGDGEAKDDTTDGAKAVEEPKKKKYKDQPIAGLSANLAKQKGSTSSEVFSNTLPPPPASTLETEKNPARLRALIKEETDIEKLKAFYLSLKDGEFIQRTQSNMFKAVLTEQTCVANADSESCEPTPSAPSEDGTKFLKRLKQPKDGDCVFSSIGNYVRKGKRAVRDEIVGSMRRTGEAWSQDMQITNWITDLI